MRAIRRWGRKVEGEELRTEAEAPKPAAWALCRPELEAPVQAELVIGEAAQRMVRLSGPVQAMVFYDGHGAGYEAVYVNGVEASVRTNWSLSRHHLVPRIDFAIPTPGGPAPARVEVVAERYRVLGGFRLTVAGQVVYAEGVYETLAEPDLPIPARTEEDGRGLPIPMAGADDNGLSPSPEGIER